MALKYLLTVVTFTLIQLAQPYQPKQPTISHIPSQCLQLHVMMRFERTIRKTHGAYKHFLSRLRDAIFIVNKDDIETLKQVLDGRWYAQRKRKTPNADEVTLLTITTQLYYNQRPLNRYNIYIILLIIRCSPLQLQVYVNTINIKHARHRPNTLPRST